jgi:signal transduction histidine kinase
VGPGVTLAVVILALAMTFTILRASLPLLAILYAACLAAVVFAAIDGGLGPGLLAATLASPFGFWNYLANFSGIFPRVADRLVLSVGVVILTYALAVTGGLARRRADALAEEVLRAEHAHAETLEKTNEELRRANDDLARANETLEAFSYVVSHDLKEPVRALRTTIRELDEDHAASLGEEGRAVLAQSSGAIERLSRLLDGLLEFSRATQIRASGLEELDVAAILQDTDCTARFENALREKSGSLEVVPGPRVEASRSGLCQVLGNLVLNSIRHNPSGTHVWVRSEAAADRPGLVRVTIEDDGAGYPPNLIEQFNRVRRGRPATLRGGFGLIIAREAVEKMGGEMSLGARRPPPGARTEILLRTAL